MSDTKSMGSAFPNDGFGRCAPDPGMSLRDYFAAKAMHAFLTSTCEEIAGEANSNPEKCAEWAYGQADAMLKAREPK